MIETTPFPKTLRRRVAKRFLSVVLEVWQKASRHPAEILCAGILFVMGANLLAVAARQSLTNDEVVHIPSGYRYLTRGDFRLNPEHPPLVKMWSGLPLLIIRPSPGVLPETGAENSGQFTVDFSGNFWHANRDRFKEITFWSRLPMVLLTLALGVLIFIYGRQLFGSRAAVIAVALFSLEPTMLAHGHIVHTDMAAALGYLLFLFTLQAYCRAPTFSRVVWFAGATGFALLTKFSMVILVPFFFAAFLYAALSRPAIKTFRRRIALHAGAAFLVVLGMLNVAYFFHHPILTRANADRMLTSAAVPFKPERIIAGIHPLSRVIPTEYLVGLYTVIEHNHSGHPASLLGDYRDSGWWYYFPVTFALKTTLPFLLLSIAALGWATWAMAFKRQRKLIALLLAVAIYAAIAMSSNINIGVRHVAPVFPILFLLSGAWLDRLLKWRGRSKTVAVLLVCLLGWMVVDAVRAYPHYLTFTNALTFGRPSWQLLSDSNVEWGEEIGDLARYLHKHGETKFVGALAADWVIPGLYEIERMGFAPPDPKDSPTRYVAIGASFLNGSTVPLGLIDEEGASLTEEQRRNYFAAYRTATPEAVFGNSIYLYRAKE